MKKKILLIIGMFLFITNVNALSFSANIVDIEDKGNNGTIGSIEKIDFANKELDVYFQDIGDEVSFELTITNSGNKAGTLKQIDVTSTNDKIEYTTNLPDGGLAIDAEDTNKVIITAKVKEGAVNGTSSSEVKITYNYDKGSCPDGEILSKDESMCLCPEGLIRNEKGTCAKADKETIECADDEIYNESKNICEKKETPVPTPDKKVTPSNPKTMDNIILVTLLFVVSGLGIYAVMFKKLKTNKKKITAGIIIGVLTLGTSFTVLASVFGLDNLLSAIVNPITKKQELIVTVNEKIDLIPTWDGGCSLTTSELTPDKIFEGGSGTPADPYQIKTANQLACFAVSVNNGNTYQGQYIKQTKNIKLNDKVLENSINNMSVLNQWTPIGEATIENDLPIVTKPFKGAYDGNNKIISGLFINNPSKDFAGLFGATDGATIKNLTLSDGYIAGHEYIGMLVSLTEAGLTVDNVKSYGKLSGNRIVAGIVGYSNTASGLYTKILNSENYSEVTANSTAMGFATFGCTVINGKNYGNITATNIAVGISSAYIIDSENHGEITGESYVAGITYTGVAFSSDNYGKINGRIIDGSVQNPYGFVGISVSGTAIDCNNYGDIDTTIGIGVAGISSSGARMYKSGNTGTITVHDHTINNSISAATIISSGTNMMSDSDLSSYAETYHDRTGRNFGARNTNSYNTGDIYVTNSNVPSITVGMVSINGCSNIHDVQSTGNMYITNVTSQGTYDYFTMIGNSGNSNTNVRVTGDIIIDNLTSPRAYIAGVGIGGPYIENSSVEGLIEVKNSTIGDPNDSYYKAEITPGATNGARIVSTSMKGNIKVHDNNFPNGAEIGGVLTGGAMATTSYNEADIEVYNNTGKAGTTLSVGGLATSGGMGVTNCYNRGNITVHDNSFDTLKVAGGVAGEMSVNGGNYNSGNIYVKDNYATAIRMGGATSYQSFNNFYNLGDITFETENNTKLTSLSVGGVNDYGHSGSSTYSNLVNTGNITIPYVPSITNLSVGGLYGIFRSPYISNAYSSGAITIGNGYTYSEDINYGNLYGTQGISYNPTGATPAAYYTQDGYAMGLSRLNSTYEALDANYGTKVDASNVPSILSIINTQDAFEILDGETLPTLKVFNQ